jgi:hypothetical protein
MRLFCSIFAWEKELHARHSLTLHSGLVLPSLSLSLSLSSLQQQQHCLLQLGPQTTEQSERALMDGGSGGGRRPAEKLAGQQQKFRRLLPRRRRPIGNAYSSDCCPGSTGKKCRIILLPPTISLLENSFSKAPLEAVKTRFAFFSRSWVVVVSQSAVDHCRAATSFN